MANTQIDNSVESVRYPRFSQSQTPMNASDITIYHNPRCSKSRSTLELIRAWLGQQAEGGPDLEVVEYLKNPLDAAALGKLVHKLGGNVSDIIRTGDTLWREVKPEDNPGTEQLLALIAAHPALMQRPIVVRGSDAVIGRPPENVNRLLNGPST